MSIPKFAMIKDYLIQKIERGDMEPGQRVPSENQLAEQFSVSRMTARKALREMADQGFLVRTQGLGSFVADARPMSSMLEIRNIADEIRSRGHRYDCEVIELAAKSASGQIAILLELPEGAEVFYSQLLHLENDAPVQLEQRYVNPLFAPEYLEQDFKQQTPNVYLREVAPLSEADHIVEAVCVTEAVAKHLGINVQEPCLKITRRTFSKVRVEQGAVSVAYLTHPGSRYRLGGHLDF
jgi:GntR family histidine utilization transcriptional repressor